MMCKVCLTGGVKLRAFRARGDRGCRSNQLTLLTENLSLQKIGKTEKCSRILN